MTLDDVMVLHLKGDTILLIPRDTPFVAIHHEALEDFAPASRFSRESHRDVAKRALPELERLVREREGGGR